MSIFLYALCVFVFLFFFVIFFLVQSPNFFLQCMCNTLSFVFTNRFNFVACFNAPTLTIFARAFDRKWGDKTRVVPSLCGLSTEELCFIVCLFVCCLVSVILPPRACDGRAKFVMVHGIWFSFWERLGFFLLLLRNQNGRGALLVLWHRTAAQ